jgi:hypothetical protein
MHLFVRPFELTPFLHLPDQPNSSKHSFSLPMNWNSRANVRRSPFFVPQEFA